MKPLSAAPEKLRLLADWLDAKHPNDDREAQEDLRHWADLIEQLLDGVVDATIAERVVWRTPTPFIEQGLLACARCGSRYPAGNAHHCPTNARFSHRPPTNA